MGTRTAYVLYNDGLESYLSPEGKPVPYRDLAAVFTSVDEATAAAPSGLWYPVSVLVHTGRDGRIIDIEPWED